jgi:hypothetical protein
MMIDLFGASGERFFSMKKAMRDHLHAYGRVRGFLTTHARLSEGVKGPAVSQDLDLYCDFCCRFQTVNHGLKWLSRTWRVNLGDLRAEFA